MRILILMLLFVVPAMGQSSNVRVTFDTQFTEGLGYQNPSVGVSIGGTKQLNRLWNLDGSVRLLRARKVDGDGFNVGGSLEARRKFSRSMFGVAGVNVSRQATSFYSKTALNPVVGVGWRLDDFYPSVRALLPDVTSPNHTYGVEVRGEYYVPTKGQIGLFLEGKVAVVRFGCFQGPVGLTDNCNGVSVTTRVGIYRKSQSVSF